MKSSKIKHISIVISFVSALFTGCSSDNSETHNNGSVNPSEDVVENIGELLIGEWFTEASQNDAYRTVYITEFNNNGTYSTIWGLTDLTDNFYTNWSGTYKLEKSTIATNYKSPFDGYEYADDWHIKSITKYVLDLYYDNQQTDKLLRIIDTYKMKVGESKQITISDSEFLPTSYASFDNKIVEVNSSGLLTGVKRGTTYIIATSTIGKAVIRVEVTDPDNYIDDFLVYLGENAKILDSDYQGVVHTETEEEGNTKLRNYRILDEKIRLVGFFYSADENIIQKINVTLRDGANLDEVKKSFENKYEFVTQDGDLYLYSTIKENRLVTIIFDTNLRGVSYAFYGIDPYEEAEEWVHNLFSTTASAYAKELGHELTDQELSEGAFPVFVNNTIFESADIYFNETDAIDFVILYTKDGVDSSTLEKWYQRNCTSTGSDFYQYLDRTGDCYIHLELGEDYSAVVYAKK